MLPARVEAAPPVRNHVLGSVVCTVAVAGAARQPVSPSLREGSSIHADVQGPRPSYQIAVCRLNSGFDSAIINGTVTGVLPAATCDFEACTSFSCACQRTTTVVALRFPSWAANSHRVEGDTMSRPTPLREG